MDDIFEVFINFIGMNNGIKLIWSENRDKIKLSNKN